MTLESVVLAVFCVSLAFSTSQGRRGGGGGGAGGGRRGGAGGGGRGGGRGGAGGGGGGGCLREGSAKCFLNTPNNQEEHEVVGPE